MTVALSILNTGCVYLHFSGLTVSGILFVQCHLPSALLKICSLFVGVSTVLQYTVRTSEVSMFGMPSNFWPVHGTTKKLHDFCLLLCSVFTLHMPNCVSVVLLHVKAVLLVFVANNCSFVTLGNKMLNI